jgi:hypothetical protein
MATTQEIMKLLVVADESLSAEYHSVPVAMTHPIDFCSLTIERIIKAIIRSDLLSQTEQIENLSQEIKGSAQDLQDLKSSINSFAQAGQLTLEARGALATLLPFL